MVQETIKKSDSLHSLLQENQKEAKKLERENDALQRELNAIRQGGTAGHLLQLESQLEAHIQSLKLAMMNLKELQAKHMKEDKQQIGQMESTVTEMQMGVEKLEEDAYG